MMPWITYLKNIVKSLNICLSTIYISVPAKRKPRAVKVTETNAEKASKTKSASKKYKTAAKKAAE